MASQPQVGLVTVEDVAKTYDFGPQHPLRPDRVLLTYEYIEKLGLSELEHVSLVPGRSATDEEILRAHSDEYVDVVKAFDRGDVDPRIGLHYGLGTGDNPIFSGMHTASAAVCGASLAAAEAVETGTTGYSFNPAGGLHHARRSEASGFCIYDDPAVAIAHVLHEHPDWRVMYVDVDVHHGDGVQWIFYEDPRVLTVSLHESGRYLYPGTGFEDEIGSGDAKGTSANIPFMPYTGNSDYLWALYEVVPTLAQAFRPHLILTQLGADTHHGDPLANLALTMDAYPRMAKILRETADEHCGGRWVATGGGGYQATTVVPKVWTTYFAEMCGRDDLIPPDWFDDLPSSEVSRSYRETVERSVLSVLEACVPRLREIAG